jgi:uncharacterized YigZ family protein
MNILKTADLLLIICLSLFPVKTSYKTIEKEGRSVFRDRGSRFMGVVQPVESPSHVKELLDNYRKEYHDARHHCYAYRLGYEGLDWRINDDGEPSGSAGKPIYGQLLSFDITNTLALVIRYFGGTKLGIPGLINAYRTATREAIMSTMVIEKEIMFDLLINFDYGSMNKVMRIIKEENLSIISSDSGIACTIHCRIPIISMSKIQDIFKMTRDSIINKSEFINISIIND